MNKIFHLYIQILAEYIKTKQFEKACGLLRRLADDAEDLAFACQKLSRSHSYPENIAFSQEAKQFFDIKNMWMKRQLMLSEYSDAYHHSQEAEEHNG
ncbi:MAG: hypothetical protein WBK76_00460 [Candidatus Saccharimonadales bacterium]